MAYAAVIHRRPALHPIESTRSAKPCCSLPHPPVSRAHISTLPNTTHTPHTHHTHATHTQCVSRRPPGRGDAYHDDERFGPVGFLEGVQPAQPPTRPATSRGVPHRVRGVGVGVCVCVCVCLYCGHNNSSSLLSPPRSPPPAPHRTLAPADATAVEKQSEFWNYYETDPERPRASEGKLRIPSTHPWNSEPKQHLLTQSGFYTPNDLFFVRNHNKVRDM